MQPMMSPTNLRELGIKGLTEEEIQALAYRCTYQETRTIGCIKKLGKKEVADIYRLAWQGKIRGNKNESASERR